MADRTDFLRWHLSDEFDVSRWGRYGGYYSDCDNYRWTFCRRWKEGGNVICWIGLNPGRSDDQPHQCRILSRIVKLSRSWGMNGLMLVNLLAWRTSDPRELKKKAKEADIVGEFNDAAIEEATSQAALTVAAWGNLGRLLNRAEKVADKLRPAKCLAFTKHNHPRHPRTVKSTLCLSDLLDFPRKLSPN